MTFEGRISITFVPFENIKTIQLHSAGLLIDQVDVWIDDSRLKTTIKVERFKPILNVQVNGGDAFETNSSYVMKIIYTGKIQHRSAGALYYNNYLDEKNVQR